MHLDDLRSSPGVSHAGSVSSADDISSHHLSGRSTTHGFNSGGSADPRARDLLHMSRGVLRCTFCCS